MGKSRPDTEGENTPPKVSAKFYKAVVQSVLFYGSKMWNLLTTALVQLEGFQICAAYCMAEKHKPRRDCIKGGCIPVLTTCSKSAGWVPSCTILTSGGT
jgi:hypothetical protein